MVISDCLSHCLSISKRVDFVVCGDLSDEVDSYVCSIENTWPATDW